MHAHKSTLALVLALGVFFVGCASPDLPTPRHPIIPLPVRDLSARQVGDTVILSFTLPTYSTDQQALSETPSVEIYRNLPAANAPPAPKRGAKNRNIGRLADSIPADALGQYQRNGRIEFSDKLAATDLANDTGTELVYTVHASISGARESADSNPASLRVYPPSPTVRDLRVTLTETALVLNWSAPQTSGASAAKPAGFQIYRAEVDPTTAQAAAADPSQATLLAPPALLAQTMETQYRDTSFQFGHTYLYTIREVMQFGTETVESGDSTPAVFTAKDIFPPAAPQGLQAVNAPAANGAGASIELTWSINTEPDVAGYNVYRSEQADMPGLKLNTELLSAPTFRDMSVAPGSTYFYRVGAVDQSGNESALGPAVEAQVPGP